MKSKRFISLSILSFLSVGLLSGLVYLKKTESKVYIPTFATYTNGDADTYYKSIDDTKTGKALLDDLRTLNLSKRQSTVGYGAMGTDPSGMFKYTDYDPDYVQYDSNHQPYGTRISSFYTYTSATSWNREHVWPNSHGGGKGGDVYAPYVDADIHMPRPTIAAENSSRGNSFFVEGMNSQSLGWDPVAAGYNANSRGEAARITFYCMTASDKLCLAASNTTPSGTDPITGITYGSGHTMGNLETLLKWTVNYPVTQREKNRNEGAEYLQGNRNAFVDHPEYACRIWGGVNSTTKSICGSILGPSVTISDQTLTVQEGQTKTISATSSDGSNISWSSSNPTVVTFESFTTASGSNVTVIGFGAGTATITASATIDGVEYSDSCQVTVTPKPVLSSITLSGGRRTFKLNETFNYTGLTVTAHYTNASDKVVTPTSVSTPDTSTLGEKTVTVTYTENDVTAYAEYKITVKEDITPIYVESVSLNETRKTLLIGDTFQLVPIFNPSDADNKDVTWSAEGVEEQYDGCITVDENGLVTAVSLGYGVVTVTTMDGGKQAYCNFKIVDHFDPTPSGGKKSGCGGNIVATSVILSSLSILGLGLLLIKRICFKNKGE